MSLMNHVSVGTNQFDTATRFYDAVMAALGAKRVMEFPGAVAYGHQVPEFWVQRPYDGKDAGSANGVHFGFNAASKAQVDAFHAAALAAGGTDDGKPGPRVDYGAQYYGAFVRDPDGNKIEAMFWDESAA
ncbi:catechol 2,3-dioxygenase-like lactoylglutathione lyase family enzyme [Silvimonas terrae]|uniref:Catechol 2,3-dioxygenase-like lactoylglutathione lyase family enzyme n=1 Tax=Silvimonas terrae TaxID=300266 RepID=A0A840RG22_9NEIS|nr:VOC family protein [Silvimonas terrae]MBB5191468.1 catechol 2,3-dioxygenase-like lactoylglutathione lyase family enzyme [Silvimonas terrae]